VNSVRVNPVPVTFVSSSAKRGGTERYLTMLLDSLAAPWISGVVCLEDGPLVESLRRRGYPTEVVPTSKRLQDIIRSAWRLRKLLRRAGSRVVHADNLKAAVVAVLATRGSPIRVVWVKHDFSWDGWLARLVGRGCEQVVGVSSSVTRTFDSQARTKVRVIHHGLPPLNVDREAGRRLLLSALGVPAHSTIIALVGRLHPYKGHRELLEVIPTLLGHRRGIHFVFVGEEDESLPQYAASLKREIIAADLQDVVTFLGHRDDAIELISGCDLVVIPTIKDRAGFGREGFSYVGLEALVAGTPVVGYDHGALPELLDGCGALVPPGDRRALAAAILGIIEDPERRRRMARCGQQRAATSFVLSRMVSKTQQCYVEAARSR
jgi:glycosyltransferase involved in cell wall biosynthesis